MITGPTTCSSTQVPTRIIVIFGQNGMQMQQMTFVFQFAPLQSQKRLL